MQWETEEYGVVKVDDRLVRCMDKNIKRMLERVQVQEKTRWKITSLKLELIVRGGCAMVAFEKVMKYLQNGPFELLDWGFDTMEKIA